MRTVLKCLIVLSFAIPVALPAQSALPTPASVLGFEPGADKKLANYEQIVEYYKKVDAASDRVPVGAQELLEQVAARVLRLAARDPIGDGEHGGVHDFVFSTSSTSNVICLSIAFAMS